MNALDFIFKLLLQFIQFEPGKYEQLKEKANAWYLEQKAKENSPFKKAIELDQVWYVQVALALGFMFAVKSIRSWLLADSIPMDDDDDDDDDSDDDDDDYSPEPQQFSPIKF